MLNYSTYRIDKDKIECYQIPEHSTLPFHEALKVLTNASGITQQELGKALHVSGVTIFNYLRGYRKNPDVEFIRKCSDFFDVKPTYFREYRIYMINEKLIELPELIDILFEVLADPKKLIKSFKSRKDEWFEYLKECGVKFDRGS